MSSAEQRLLDAADRTAKATALELWTGDRAQLVFTQPLVASLALQLPLVPVVDHRLPTAATDGRVIYVNAYWVQTLRPAERLFVLAHEVWHNALLHSRRCGTRDPERWNIAIDHEVNVLLREAGFTMPAEGILFEELVGLSAEQVYEELREMPQPPRPINADVHLDAGGVVGRGGRGGGGGTGAREAPQGGTGAGRGGDTSEEDPAPDAPSPGDGTPSSPFGPIEGKWDDDYRGRLDTEAVEEWAERMVALGGSLPGTMPGALKAVLQSMGKPNVPWYWLLRDFVTRAAGGRLRWLPPSRRHVHRGLYLPSRREDLLQVAVAIDTSGSTIMEWPRFQSELIALMRSFGRYELRLLQCDAQITHDRVYDDVRAIPKGLAVSGGGGTEFVPVFDRLASSPPQALIFFTDGYGDAPRLPPPYPVLWLLTPDGTPPVRWGRVVSMAQGRTLSNSTAAYSDLFDTDDANDGSA